MNRREAISSLAILAGGMWITKSCSFDLNEASIALENYKMTKKMEDLLSEVSKTILPLEGNEPDEIKNLHLFVMKMVDDCHSTEEQKLFTDGLIKFEKGNWTEKAIPFDHANDQERTDMITFLNGGEDSDIKKCYEIIKRRTIQGYNNSAYLMKGKGTYELVPGRYNGYAKV
jgi:hypothetical protein